MTVLPSVSVNTYRFYARCKITQNNSLNYFSTLLTNNYQCQPKLFPTMFSHIDLIEHLIIITITVDHVLEHRSALYCRNHDIPTLPREQINRARPCPCNSRRTCSLVEPLSGSRRCCAQCRSTRRPPPCVQLVHARSCRSHRCAWIESTQ